MALTATFEYVGYSDYWGGNGRRWDRNAGCAFAFYGRDTTLRDIVDQWVDDTWQDNNDFDEWPEEITQDDIRVAILDILSAQGRADYESGALCEWAADLEDNRECRDCGEMIGNLHSEDCQYFEEGEEYEVIADECDDDDDDYGESPIAVVLLEYDACPDCGKPSGVNTTDDLCNECHCKHYSAWELHKEFTIYDGHEGWHYFWIPVAGNTDEPVGPFRNENDAIEGHPEKVV